MKKYSFLIRLIMLILSVILCLSLIIGVFSKANTLTLKAKLDSQKVVLSIEEETKKTASQSSLANASNADLANNEHNQAIDSIKDSSVVSNYTDIANKKAISIVVTDLGLARSVTEKAFTLPSEVTLGFSPYTINIEENLKKAISLGHESLINLPMEAKNYPQDDPGPLGLLKSLSNLENFQRLETILGSNSNYVGVYSNTDEVFSDSNSKMQPFLKYFQTHKLLYVYGGPPENQAFRQFAEQIKFPLLNVDLVLDENISEEYIKSQVALLEKISDKQGYAIGFARAYPVTVDILKEWLPTLESKGIYLVPISILNKKMMDSK